MEVDVHVTVLKEDEIGNIKEIRSGVIVFVYNHEN